MYFSHFAQEIFISHLCICIKVVHVISVNFFMLKQEEGALRHVILLKLLTSLSLFCEVCTMHMLEVLRKTENGNNFNDNSLDKVLLCLIV